MSNLDAPPSDAPAPRPKRWRMRLFRGTLALLVVVALLYVFRQPLFGRLLADQVGASLSDALGVPLKVDRVLGTWVADARVEGISIDTATDKSVIQTFDAKSIRVEFSLWKILRGDVVEGIESVKAEGLRIGIDLTQDVEPDDEPSDMTLGEIIEEVPHSFPPIDVRADLHVISGAGRFDIDGVHITCAGSPVIALQADHIVCPDPAGDLGPLDARLRRDARGLRWESKSKLAGLVLESVDADHEGVVDVTGEVAGAALAGRFGNGRASASTGEMRAADVPAWILRLIPIQRLRPSAGTLAVAFDAPTLSPFLANVTLKGTGIALPEDHISRLEAEARIDDGALTVTKASLRAATAHIDLREVVVDPSRPLGVVSLTKASVRVDDLRRFLESLDREVRAELEAHSTDARTIQLERLRVHGDGLDVQARGVATIPDAASRAEDLADTTIELDAHGHASNITLGDLAIRGRLDLDGAVHGDLIRPTVTAQISGADLNIDGHEVSSLQATARLHAGVAHVADARASGPWGQLRTKGRADLELAKGTIEELSGSLLGHDVQLTAPAQFAWGEATQLNGLALRALGGQARGSLTLRPTLAAELAFEDLDLAVLDARVAGRATGSLQFAGLRGALTCRVPDFAYDGQRGSVTASAKHSEAGLHDIDLRVEAGEAISIHGTGQLPWRIDADGLHALDPASARFAMDVQVATLDTWIDAPISDLRATLRVEGIDLRASGSAQLGTEGLRDGQLTWQVETGAQATHLSAKLADADQTPLAELMGTIGAGWQWTRPAELPESPEALPLDGRVQLYPTLLGALDGAWLTDQLGGASISGELSSDVQVQGSWHNPVFNGVVSFRGALTPLNVTEPVQVPRLELTLGPDTAELTDLLAQHRGAELRASGNIGWPAQLDGDWLAQPLELSASFNVPNVGIAESFVPALTGLSGRVQGRTAVGGTARAPVVHGELQAANVIWPIPSLGETLHVPSLRVSLDDERVTVQDATARFANAQAALRGWVERPDGLDLDALLKQPMAVALRAQVPDFTLLHRFLPEATGVQGRARAELVVRGSVAQPSVTGELVAEQLKYPIEGTALTARAEALRVIGEPGQLRLTPATIQVGGAGVQLQGTLAVPQDPAGDWSEQALDLRANVDLQSLELLRLVHEELRHMRGGLRAELAMQGTLGAPQASGHVLLREISGRLPGGLSRLDNFGGRIELENRRVSTKGLRGEFGRSPFSLVGHATLPQEGSPTMDVRVQGEHLQLLRTNELRLRADVDVAVRGALDRLATTGKIDISDLVYATPMDILEVGSASAGDGQAIELFSIEDGPLQRMTFDIAVRADNTIRVRNNTLRGNVSADLHLVGTGVAPALDGHVSFPDMLVKLPFSSLKVDNGEARFDRSRPGQPRIQAQAHTEMMGYELDVYASGTYPDIEVRVASSPPLPQHEALLLLTTGATSEQLAQEGLARATLTRLAGFFGKRLFAGDVGPEDPDEKGFFDRFAFTQGRRVSRSGQETIEAEYELNERFFLRVERDRYDDFNAGAVWRWRFR